MILEPAFGDCARIKFSGISLSYTLSSIRILFAVSVLSVIGSLDTSPVGSPDEIISALIGTNDIPDKEVSSVSAGISEEGSAVESSELDSSAEEKSLSASVIKSRLSESFI